MRRDQPRKSVVKKFCKLSGLLISIYIIVYILPAYLQSDKKLEVFIPGRLSVIPASTWENRAVLFHSPGGAGDYNRRTLKRLGLLKLEVIQPNTFVASNITFITYNNKDTPVLFEKFCKAYNFEHSAVIAKNYGKWNWNGKIGPLLEYLEKDCKTEYIIAADGFDVAILLDRIQDYYDGYLIRVFESFDCSILFCNSKDDWPPIMLYKKFESDLYQESQMHNHLSAGGFMGKRKYIIERLKEIYEAYVNNDLWVLFDGRFDDALAWRAMHYKYYPQIKVDSKCALWSRYDDVVLIP